MKLPGVYIEKIEYGDSGGQLKRSGISRGDQEKVMSNLNGY